MLQSGTNINRPCTSPGEPQVSVRPGRTGSRGRRTRTYVFFLLFAKCVTIKQAICFLHVITEPSNKATA